MGVSYLLDTHVLLWLLGDPARVPDPVRTRLADAANRLLVSAASGLEIATKIRIGRLAAVGDLPASLPRRVARMGASEVPISLDHALLAGSMPWPHRDPFDRILIAQATLEDATLVTVDRAMSQLPAPSILSW